jgi:hypothetical protein
VRTVRWQETNSEANSGGVGSVRLARGQRGGGTLFGQQRISEVDIAWQLGADAGWCVEYLDVRVVGRTPKGRLSRTLLLERNSSGWHWRAWRSDALDDLSPPGFGEFDDGRCDHDVLVEGVPLLHAVPLRRWSLAPPPMSRAAVSPVRARWQAQPVLRVLVPSLAVVATRHSYLLDSDGQGVRHLRHEFANASSTPISVDSSGVPLKFGDLRIRHDTALVA